MHTYTKKWIDDPDLPPPDLRDARFRRAEDVAEFATADRTIGWMTWPLVHHLDGTGAITCGYSASSLCSLQRWSEDPAPLWMSRLEGLADPQSDCGSEWLIIDSRPGWRSETRAPVSEADARHFSMIRDALGRIGVCLLDAMVFDDDGHWWSLHELTSGTTEWHGCSSVES